MCNHHDCWSCFFVKICHEFHGFVCVIFIKVSGWFISKQDISFGNKCPCESDSLLFSSWENICVSFFFTRKSDHFNDFFCVKDSLAIVHFYHKINIFFDSELRKKEEVLKDKRNMFASIFSQLFIVVCVEIMMHSLQISFILCFNTSNHIKKCCFTRSATSHDSDIVSLSYFSVEVFVDMYGFTIIVICFCDVCKGNYWFHESEKYKNRAT